MNTDTLRTVNQIKNNGYYRQGVTMGEMGWSEVYSLSANWKRYVLVDGMGDVIERITARDDDTAVKAFGELYHLDNIPGYEIHEKIMESRLVKAGDE